MPGTKRGGGPKTAAGKAAIANNNLRHGLLSRRLLLAHEDPHELDALSDRLHSQLQPVGPLETLLVDRILAATWRLTRALNAETRQMQRSYRLSVARSAFDDYRAGEQNPDADPDPELVEQAYNLAESRIVNDNNLDRIGRYETAIERQLYRALHALQTLQASLLTGMPLIPGAYRIFIQQPKSQPATDPSPETPTP